MQEDQISKTVEYWLSSANYDLEVADSLFSKKNIIMLYFLVILL